MEQTKPHYRMDVRLTYCRLPITAETPLVRPGEVDPEDVHEDCVLALDGMASR